MDWDTSEVGERSYSAERRRLAKTPDDEVIDGVCGGIAAYFGLDATIVRIVAVVLLFSGVGLVIPAYIALMCILPDAPAGYSRSKRRRRDRDRVGLWDEFADDAETRSPARCSSRRPRASAGWLLIGVGAYVFLDRVDWINPTIVVALAMVTLGINLIVRRGD